MSDVRMLHLPRIGLSEAMRLYGMTARALRFYEEKGLVDARRDRNNMRHYDAVARRRLDWIARLRRANLSLPDIAEVLKAEDDGGHGCERAIEALARHRASIAASLAEVDDVLAALNAPTPARADHLRLKVTQRGG